MAGMALCPGPDDSRFGPCMMSLCLTSFSAQTGLAGSLFLAGFLGGFTHCAGMCGPFVLAQISAQPGPGALAKIRAAALFPYHMGRLTTYVTLAVAFQSVLNIAIFYSPAKTVLSAGLLLMAALIFLVNIAPPIARLFPWLVRLRLPVPPRLVERAAQPVLKESRPSLPRRYLLGVLLGFMPCGMVIAALMAAAGAATPYQAGIAMLSFGLGTLPALWLVAAGGRVALLRWPRLVPVLSTVMMSVSILVLLATAGKMLFS